MYIPRPTGIANITNKWQMTGLVCPGIPSGWKHVRWLLQMCLSHLCMLHAIKIGGWKVVADSLVILKEGCGFV